jgi:DegV family protein with EDD domain
MAREYHPPVPSVALLTDTTADLPPILQAELGVRVCRASASFAEHSYVDGELPSGEFFGRMRTAAAPPIPSAVTEDEFRAAFEAALAEAHDAVCLLMPFDVVASFTTAGIVAAELERAHAGRRAKVINAGVASAGLGALVASLADGVRAGMGLTDVVAAVDEHGPLCDALFVPESSEWLARTGRLELICDKLGELEDDALVARAGTRITGVARCPDRAAALARAVELVGKRAGGDRPLVVLIDHAGSPDLAGELAERVRLRWKVERLVVTELSPTFGSQLGPGAIGIGVAPVLKR